MPDYLAISVGDGCTIAGVWKGLKDLYAIGFIDKLPRLISAQAEGCPPINRAIAENKPWEPMEENTLADSIAVGVPRNADKALMAIRESNGIVVNVTDAIKFCGEPMSLPNDLELLVEEFDKRGIRTEA